MLFIIASMVGMQSEAGIVFACLVGLSVFLVLGVTDPLLDNVLMDSSPPDLNATVYSFASMFSNAYAAICLLPINLVSLWYGSSANYSFEHMFLLTGALIATAIFFAVPGAVFRKIRKLPAA